METTSEEKVVYKFMLELIKDGEVIDTITPFQKSSVNKEYLEGKKLYIAFDYHMYETNEDGVYAYVHGQRIKKRIVGEGFIHFYFDIETVKEELDWYANIFYGTIYVKSSDYCKCIIRLVLYKCVIPPDTPYCKGYLEDSYIESGCAQQIRFVERIDPFVL